MATLAPKLKAKATVTNRHLEVHAFAYPRGMTIAGRFGRRSFTLALAVDPSAGEVRECARSAALLTDGHYDALLAAISMAVEKVR